MKTGPDEDLNRATSTCDGRYRGISTISTSTDIYNTITYTDIYDNVISTDIYCAGTGASGRTTGDVTRTDPRTRRSTASCPPAAAGVRERDLQTIYLIII